ncbi:hypothetical protein [Hymenobacter psoromatis]|uniref:hypothetical protein n=1 Tax=Hymenobacter psoromatis TaxID=1484116 RepID=UPI001CBB1A96|nr:hypothetical protein [Hymenobacter psoromatis]
MKTCLFLFSFLFLLHFTGRTQVPTTSARRDSSIKVAVIQQGRYSSVLYTMNGEPITNSTIKSLLKSYPKSALELRKCRAQKRLALGLLPVFIAGIIIGGVQSDKHKDAAGSPFSKAPVPFSIGLSAWFGSIILLATNNHYAKAIEAYNSQFK